MTTVNMQTLQKLRWMSWEGMPEEESSEATWEKRHRGCGHDILGLFQVQEAAIEKAQFQRQIAKYDWWPTVRKSSPHAHVLSPFYHFSARQLITHFTVPWRIEGWVEQGTTSRVCGQCPYYSYVKLKSIHSGVWFVQQHWHFCHRQMSDVRNTYRRHRMSRVWIWGADSQQCDWLLCMVYWYVVLCMCWLWFFFKSGSI